MTDPFTFDEDRIVFEHEPGETHVWMTYPVIWGHINSEFIHKESLEQSRQRAKNGESKTGTYRRNVERMRTQFNAHVASLTAHQKLQWLAAAQKEQDNGTL